MITSPQLLALTPEEYLALEQSSAIKHEYIDGHAYAMAGASDAHVTIALNCATLLRSHLRGSACRVYISDMKAQIQTLNRYFYPDVMVTCDPRDLENRTYKQHPKVIIEILSDSTEAFDRGDKFTDYQQLDSLQEYVLINSKRQRIDIFRRQSSGLWLLENYNPEKSQIQIQCLDFQTTLEVLYEDVILDVALDPVTEQ